MTVYRRLFRHALIALVLFLAASPAAAAPGGHQVITETVTFSIPADQCPELPAGVSVSGTGERMMIINTYTTGDGATEVRIMDLIKGTAVDSNGGLHKFVYQNSSTETVPPSGDHTFEMNDLFVLSGPGPQLNVTFTWRWAYNPDLGEEFWPPARNLETLHGDPDIIFACDPL